MSAKQQRQNLIDSYKNILSYLGADIEDELADFTGRLDSLLEQLAKEQREICAKEVSNTYNASEPDYK